MANVSVPALQENQLPFSSVACDRRDFPDALWNRLRLETACRVCHRKARLELTDLMVPEALPVRWPCPCCRRQNGLPILGRLESIEKIPAESY